MRFWFLTVLALGCVSPTATDTTPIDTDSTSTTGDTSVPTVIIRHAIFEVDRQCWSVREEPLPESYWGNYLDNGCNGRATLPSPPYADPDGNCIGFYGPFEGNCEVQDPWLRDCSESSEPTCCTTLKEMPTCDPGAYQP